MATKLKPGTARDPQGRLPHYTIEQFDALEGLSDAGWSPRFARAEFANAVLCPDGSIIKQAAKKVLAAVEEKAAGSTTTKRTPATLRAQADALSKVTEVEEHIAEARFLFIVDAEMQPVTYYQCAVAGNPEFKAKGVTKVKK